MPQWCRMCLRIQAKKVSADSILLLQCIENARIEAAAFDNWLQALRTRCGYSKAGRRGPEGFLQNSL